MTDLHSLIHRMADELDHYRQLLMDDRREVHALATEARAALAEPVPVLPEGTQVIEPTEHTLLVPVAQPIPVSECLPGPRDCDAEGRCWWGRAESDDWSADWTLATPEAVAEFCEFSPRVVWLPAHALPLPTHTSENVLDG